MCGLVEPHLSQTFLSAISKPSMSHCNGKNPCLYLLISTYVHFRAALTIPDSRTHIPHIYFALQRLRTAPHYFFIFNLFLYVSLCDQIST